VPADNPGYLMGVGSPENTVERVLVGVDWSVCVLPTRLPRNGRVAPRGGRLAAKTGVSAGDADPRDGACDCPVGRRHSRAYIRHLFAAGEMLGPMLATIHNLHFYQSLMRDIRGALSRGRLRDYADPFLARWRAGEAARREAALNAKPGGH
ncbi:tRNA-guanine transglycosylase, partial [bacterium]|nr:tRNA-guanine transglycosylase [bacterium]